MSTSNEPIPAPLMALMQQQTDLVSAGRIAEADALSPELLAELCRWTEESLPDDPELQEELVLQAHAEAGEWETVERMYKSRLDRSSEALPYGSACHNLAQFLTLMDRWDEAAHFAALATEAARQEDLPLLLAMRLGGQGRIANACREDHAALSLLDEGLRVLEAKATHDLVRAALLIDRAHSHLRLGNLEACQVDQGAAWKCLQAFSVMLSASGVQCAFAAWWRVQAERNEAAGDWQSAHDARAAVVHYCREIVQLAETQQIYPLYQALIPLSRELLPLARSLARLGQTAAAEELRDEALAMRQRVHLPT